MRLGTLDTHNNIFLAPMAGVSDLPFRRLCKKYGCGFTYSEMVSAKGLFYNDKKTYDLMELSDEEKPAAIQIFGSDVEVMGNIVKRAEKTGAALIDINMGCPTPKIVNNGDGCALMKNPELAGRIIKTVVDNATVPVSVKIRAGWDDESINAVQMAKIAEENGACAITVHARTREQFYSGSANRDIIKSVVDAVSIPVIGNGDIFCAEDAKTMLEETGCAGVMVARGAQGNPFIFRQINELMSTGKVTYYPDKTEKINTAIELLLDIVKTKGERRGVKEARKHIAWFIKGMKNSSEVKNRIFSMTDYKEVIKELEKMCLSD